MTVLGEDRKAYDLRLGDVVDLSGDYKEPIASYLAYVVKLETFMADTRVHATLIDCAGLPCYRDWKKYELVSYVDCYVDAVEMLNGLRDHV